MATRLQSVQLKIGFNDKCGHRLKLEGPKTLAAVLLFGKME